MLKKPFIKSSRLTTANGIIKVDVENTEIKDIICNKKSRLFVVSVNILKMEKNNFETLDI